MLERGYRSCVSVIRSSITLDIQLLYGVLPNTYVNIPNRGQILGKFSSTDGNVPEISNVCEFWKCFLLTLLHMVDICCIYLETPQ